MSRRSDRLAATGSPMAMYWVQQRNGVRWIGVLGLPFTLAGIPVAAAHGVPLPLAVLAGVAVAAGQLVVVLTWHRRWSSTAAALVHLLNFWPAVVWPYWAAFPAFFLLPVLLATLMDRGDRRTALALENAWRAEDGRPPYELTQESVDEAYRSFHAARRGGPVPTTRRPA